MAETKHTDNRQELTTTARTLTGNTDDRTIVVIDGKAYDSFKIGGKTMTRCIDRMEAHRILLELGYAPQLVADKTRIIAESVNEAEGGA